MKSSVQVQALFLHSYWARMVGLIGKSALTPGQAVWIAPCRQIHTLGMRYAIDVIALSSIGLILDIQTLKPWRIGRWHKDSAGILEMAAGEAERLNMKKGLDVDLVQVLRLDSISDSK
jgi:uncharacterized protein